MSANQEPSSELLLGALDQLGHGLAIFDAQLRLVASNRPFAQTLALSQGLEQPGTPLSSIYRSLADRSPAGPVPALPDDPNPPQAGPAPGNRRFRGVAANGLLVEIVQQARPDGSFVVTCYVLGRQAPGQPAPQAQAQDTGGQPAGHHTGDANHAEQTAESLLRESTQTLRSVLEHSLMAIYFKDTQGRFMMVNRKFEEYYCPRGQALGKTITEILGNEPSAEEFTNVDKTVMNTQEALEYETKASWPDGRPDTDFLTVKFPIFNADGSVLGVGGFDMDITERKRAEADLRAARDELEQRVERRTAELSSSHRELERALAELKNAQAVMVQSEKMASIGQLAAGVAHEINNPTGFVSSNLGTLVEYTRDIKRLTAAYRTLADIAAKVNGHAALSEQLSQVRALEESLDLPFLLEDIDSLVSESRDGIDRIRRIVETLKDFAHPGQGATEFANVNDLLDTTLKMVHNEIKYKATVDTQYGPLPDIQCLRHELNQVFLNLLVNAAQAVEDQGKISVTTRALRDGQVEVVISDNGCGIAPENLQRVFDPFFTTKEVGKGTGLGLNLVYNIVKKHHGAVEVASEPGKGTAFTIRLPVDPGDMSGAAGDGG